MPQAMYNPGIARHMGLPIFVDSDNEVELYEIVIFKG